MIDLIISGCNGKMGNVLTHLALQRGFNIKTGFDINSKQYGDFPVFSNPEDFVGNADVIIDFSHPSYFNKVLSFAVSRKTPAVIATTGLSSSQINDIKRYSSSVPFFYSANMSIGVNLLIELVKKAAAVLNENYDIEIIEKHHNLKIDAPSGTALMLADAISSTLPSSNFVYDRHSKRAKRDKNEIGIHSVRGGTIVGDHEVIFAGTDEIIELKHTATSKEIFASGALRAAQYIIKKAPGLYTMTDLVSEDI